MWRGNDSPRPIPRAAILVDNHLRFLGSGMGWCFDYQGVVMTDGQVRNKQREIAAAIERERESCAQIAELEMLEDPDPHDDGDRAYDEACRHIAAAIRARGK